MWPISAFFYEYLSALTDGTNSRRFWLPQLIHSSTLCDPDVRWDVISGPHLSHPALAITHVKMGSWCLRHECISALTNPYWPEVPKCVCYRLKKTTENTAKFVLSVVILVLLKNSLWILSNLCCGTTELFQHKYQFGIKKVFVVQSWPLKTLVYQLSQKIKVLV